MPTSRSVTPHRVPPFILAIPLLLLLVAIPPVPVDTGIVPISVHSTPCGFHKAPVPVPWEDDAFTDGIPPGPAGNGIQRRRVRSSGIVPRNERSDKKLAVRSRAVGPRLALIETLLDSFLIGLPPPVEAPVA